MQFDIFTASIIALPACYAAVIGFQFVSGLVSLWNRPTAPIAPEAPATEVQPAAPAFIPNADQPTYTAADHALVESYYNVVDAYWESVPTDNVVPFVRPIRDTQKLQQAVLDFTGMTLAQMRKLGTGLKIRGAARWNRAQAIDALTRFYNSANAA